MPHTLHRTTNLVTLRPSPAEARLLLSILDDEIADYRALAGEDEQSALDLLTLEQIRRQVVDGDAAFADRDWLRRRVADYVERELLGPLAHEGADVARAAADLRIAAALIAAAVAG